MLITLDLHLRVCGQVRVEGGCWGGDRGEVRQQEGNVGQVGGGGRLMRKAQS